MLESRRLGKLITRAYDGLIHIIKNSFPYTGGVHFGSNGACVGVILVIKLWQRVNYNSQGDIWWVPDVAETGATESTISVFDGATLLPTANKNNHNGWLIRNISDNSEARYGLQHMFIKNHNSTQPDSFLWLYISIFDLWTFGTSPGATVVTEWLHYNMGQWQEKVERFHWSRGDSQRNSLCPPLWVHCEGLCVFFTLVSGSLAVL